MKTFIILGMHRSATSLVAKGISTIIHVGDQLIPPSPSQPEGHYENIKFVNLNDEILKEAGGSWDKPPCEEAILATKALFQDKIQRLLAQESEGKELWGWKDPRTILTIKLYLPYIESPHIICCFRDIDEVAKSLSIREGFSESFCKDLANIYNRRLVKFLGEYYG